MMINLLPKRCPRQHGHKSSHSRNYAGLTLIESLVAIVLIGISAVLIGPVLVLATATRVQSQRTEQAFQLAQAEVDRIKFTVADNNVFTVDAALVDPAVLSTADFGAVDPPNVIDNTAFSTTTDAAKEVDIDSDGETDYAIQVFRTDGLVDENGSPVAFDLGVRVYNAQDLRDGRALSNQQGRVGLGFVTSDEAPGGDGLRPRPALSVITTTVLKSDNNDSLCDYHTFIDSVSGTTTTLPDQCL